MKGQWLIMISHNFQENKDKIIVMEHQHHIQKYTRPMHPQVVQDGPGKCPCGMTLEPKNSSPGHAGKIIANHTGMIADFKKRFYVVLGTYHSHLAVIRNDSTLAGYLIDFPGSKYFACLSYHRLLFFYGGWPFLKGLVNEAKAKIQVWCF